MFFYSTSFRSKIDCYGRICARADFVMCLRFSWLCRYSFRSRSVGEREQMVCLHMYTHVFAVDFDCVRVSEFVYKPNGDGEARCNVIALICRSIHNNALVSFIRLPRSRLFTCYFVLQIQNIQDPAD